MRTYLGTPHKLFRRAMAAVLAAFIFISIANTFNDDDCGDDCGNDVETARTLS